MTVPIAGARGGRRIDTTCTVTVRHTDETLEAHVELHNGLLPDVGDKITVYGAPIAVDYGREITFTRPASLVRGNALDRAWIKIRSLFELTELYEVSFSTGRLS